ncbi:MAG: hypothetical protein KDK37_11670, partial [Leptospiraceae bacterium]|nr:hypothetical protein [Leptospiraceae bacterium]
GTVLVLLIYSGLQFWPGPVLRNRQGSAEAISLILAIWALELPAIAYLNGSARRGGRSPFTNLWAYSIWGIFRLALGAQIIAVAVRSVTNSSVGLSLAIVVLFLKEAASVATFGLKYECPVRNGLTLIASLFVAGYAALGMSVLQTMVSDMQPGGFPFPGDFWNYIGALMVTFFLILFYSACHPHQILNVFYAQRWMGILLILAPPIFMVVPYFYSESAYREVLQDRLICATDLNLANLNLVRLKDSDWAPVCACNGLRSLELRGNDLSHMPYCLADHPLKYLGLAHNRIRNAGLHLDLQNGFRNISVLDLRFNRLHTFPRSLSVIHSLVGLGISGPLDGEGEILEPEYMKRNMPQLRRIYLLQADFDKSKADRLRKALPGVSLIMQKLNRATAIR